ncbi:ABCB family ABC transporter ATP-binding protein/permease [Rhodoligotrophos defluvii]|uniref:ABCB family ABC transporter ATP-binding protein/permease n=1 Tax=Rhodoligotrophos defluvii TaxID=2561934 RepID=UPI0010C98351|nr:ABC transporter ATP-binding protein/permease [Rhodoligotrophos defluvii]
MPADTKAMPPAPSRSGHIATMRAVLPYLWPEHRPDLRLRVVLALIALVAAKITTVATPYAFKYAVDALAPVSAADAARAPGAALAVAAVPLALILAYAAGRIAMVLFAQLRDGLFARVGQSAVRRLADRTFRHLHDLSLRFHLERRTGGLSRIVERGTKGIETILRYSVFNTVPTLVELSFVCGILAWQFGWVYAAVTAVTVLFYIAFTYRATEWRLGLRRAMNDADTDANTKAIDSLLNFETVKYFANEEHEASRFDRSMARYEKAATRTMTSLAVLNSGQIVIFTIGLAAITIMAARDVVSGAMTVGDFVLINAFLIQLYMPLNFLGSTYRDIKQGLIDIEAMFQLLGVAPEIRDKPGAPDLRVSAGEIVFDDVHFAYDPERPILRGVSFTVPAGATVAIVGPSGAGKSTISRLLYRFYDVNRGTIRIDGQSIADVTQVSLRRAIGMVPQDTVLFNDSIRYNIEYGRPGASDEEIIEAGRLAQVHEFIMGLPHGYKTIVGERGLKLSGGEKQRVAIARTILKGPPILVLDEATSALDTHTEREIQAALSQVSRNRTTLVIAHRLSTVVDADEIIVLVDGRIAERGTHSALLARGGIYAGMWNRQREEEHAREVIEEAEFPFSEPFPADDHGLDDDGIHRVDETDIADSRPDVEDRAATARAPGAHASGARAPEEIAGR